MCQGLNSHYFHIIGNKLINPIVEVYIPTIRIPSLKVGGLVYPQKNATGLTMAQMGGDVLTIPWDDPPSFPLRLADVLVILVNRRCGEWMGQHPPRSPENCIVLLDRPRRYEAFF